MNVLVGILVALQILTVIEFGYLWRRIRNSETASPAATRAEVRTASPSQVGAGLRLVSEHEDGGRFPQLPQIPWPADHRNVELGANVPALAKRMGKTEDEVLFLLRRRRIAS
jgi:hypothetical protein